MAGFDGTVLTKKGLSLQAKVQAGETPLEFTKLKFGDGLLAAGVNLQDLTELIAPKKEVGIQGIEVVGDGTTRVRCIVTNTSLAVGFFVREIGLYATDPDEGEILYAVANSGEYADYLPADSGSITVEHVLDIFTAVGSTQNVTAIIDPSAVLATQKDVDELNQEVIDLRAQLLSMVIQLATIQGAAVGGVTANIFFDDLADLGDITVTHGVYDQAQRKIYV